MGFDAGVVEVFEAEQKASAGLACAEPGDEEGSCVSEVERAGRRGREATGHGAAFFRRFHQRSIYPHSVNTIMFQTAKNSAKPTAMPIM